MYTVTPYFRAIPWRVSVEHIVCFTKFSVRVMCLDVLPYFFNVFPLFRMHLRSSISLAPFRSIVRLNNNTHERIRYSTTHGYLTPLAIEIKYSIHT